MSIQQNKSENSPENKAEKKPDEIETRGQFQDPSGGEATTTIPSIG